MCAEVSKDDLYNSVVICKTLVTGVHDYHTALHMHDVIGVNTVGGVSRVLCLVISGGCTFQSGHFL